MHQLNPRTNPASTGAGTPPSAHNVDAERFAAARHRLEIRAGADAVPAGPPALRDPSAITRLRPGDNPVTQYLSGRSARPTSMRGYRQGLDAVRSLLVASGLGDLETPLEEFPWHCVTPAIATAFFERACLRYPNSKSRCRYLSALRRVLAQCSRVGLLTLDEREAIMECLPARRSAPQPPAGSEITIEELVRIVAGPGVPTDARGLRDTAMFEVLIATAMRSAELVDLLVTDWCPPDGTLSIARQKNQRPRVVALTPGARAALTAWLAVRGDQGGALFCAQPEWQTERPIAVGHVNPLLRERCAKVGITRRITSHDFRRTAITRMMRGGTDPFTVARCVDHRDVSTTMLYDRRSEAEDAAAFLLLELPDVPGRRVRPRDADGGGR